MCRVYVVFWCLVVAISHLSAETALAGEKIIQLGVASSQSNTQKLNIEQLRQRAIRNAMDLAVLQVTGAEISSERSGSIRTREETIINNEQVQDSSQQQSRFNTAVRSRTEGHARLVKINKEWQDGEQYYVEATFIVDTPDEILARKNAGYYWKGAGSPPIGLAFVEDFDGEKNEEQDNTTLRYLRDNLSKNDLAVTATESGSHYMVKVHQLLSAKEMADFGTITMNCRLSFQIMDQLKGEIIAEYRASNGPDAGFTMEQARDNCLKAIAPEVSEQLIRKIAKIMNDRMNNGIEQKVTIHNVPGRKVSKITEILNNLYRVTGTLAPSYNDAKYIQEIKYKGNGGELVQAIQNAFADEDWVIQVERIAAQTIQLNWIEVNK